MSLFKVDGLSVKNKDKELLKKTKEVKTIKKSNRLIDRIESIRTSVNAALGKHKDEYIVIRDLDALDKYINSCVKNGIVAIDTETTGLNPMLDKCVGICLYTPKQPACYIPINHVDYITNERLENQLTEEEVKPYIDKLNETKIIMFNATFDIRVLRNQIGSYLKCYWDVYIASKMLNENEQSGGLKALHQKYVLKNKEDEFSFGELFDNLSFNIIPIDIAYMYAAHDAIVTYELYEYQTKFLNDNSIRDNLSEVYHVFMDIEMPVVDIVCDMEDTGVALDKEFTEQLSEKYNKSLEEAKEKVYKEIDKHKTEIKKYISNNGKNADKLDDPINIDSSTQLAILYYDILGTRVVDKKSPRGTGVAILKTLGDDLSLAILEYRKYKKLITTYIDKLPKDVNPNDGRIHGKFNQVGTVTGRFSSNGPNLQNIPAKNKDIRKMFKATDGYVMMSSDFSQQEPKLMAQISNDEQMLKAAAEGKDLYAEIASASFNTTYENCLEFFPKGTPIKEVDGEWVMAEDGDYDKLADGEHDTNYAGKGRRAKAKVILLGILYGMQENTIAETLGCSVEEAEDIRNSVYDAFPNIKKFEEETIANAKKTGYVTTLWGRKRRLPILKEGEYAFSYAEEGKGKVPADKIKHYTAILDKAKYKEKFGIVERALEKDGIVIKLNSNLYNDSIRQSINSVVQGSAADMSKKAMIAVANSEEMKELGGRILIVVHDEIILECPKKNAKRVAELFAKLMSECATDKLSIPIKCDVTTSERWSGKEYEFDFDEEE